MRIAMVLAPELQDRIFRPDQLDRLATLGELVRADDRQMTQTARGADVLVTSWGCPRIDDAILDVAPDLGLVVHAAGTVKGIVSPQLWRAGVRVSSAAGPLSKGVGETALGMTIASLKNLWRLAADAAGGGWAADRWRVRELYEVTIGVVGAGHAGSHYLRLLRPYDAELLVYDPFIDAERAAELGAQQVELAEVLRRSDVVALHAPSIPETRHMIDAAALETMKHDAILINTARGSLVDEVALVAKLRRGHLFACLDVTDPEPPAADHPFRTLPNCVLTGHVAGAVTNGLHRLGQHVVDELTAYVAGDRLGGEVREAELSTLA